MDENKNDQVAINYQIEQHCTRIVYDKALSGVSNVYFIFLIKIDMFKMFKYFLSFSSSIEIVYSTSINYEKNESESCFWMSFFKETGSLTNLSLCS